MTGIQSCEGLGESFPCREMSNRKALGQAQALQNKQRPAWLESREGRESGVRYGQEGGLGQTIDLVGHDRL